MLTVHGRATSLNVQAVMWLLAELDLPSSARPRLPLRRHRHPRVPGDEPERPRPDPRTTSTSPCSRAPRSCATSPPATPASRSGPRTRSPARPSTCGPNGARPRCSRASSARSGSRCCSAAPAPATPPGTRPAPASRRKLDILEAQLGPNPWVTGPDFTLADIEIGLPLYRYFTIDMDRRDRPTLAAYYAPPDRAPGLRRATSWSPTTSSKTTRSDAGRLRHRRLRLRRLRRRLPALARPATRSRSSSTAAPTGARSSRCRRRSPTR